MTRGLLGRIGGVLFDVEAACHKYQAELPPDAMEHLAGPPDLHNEARKALVDVAAQTIMVIAQMDAQSRITCTEPDHDRFGHRKSDCTECFAVEQASLSTSLAVLARCPNEGRQGPCDCPVCVPPRPPQSTTVIDVQSTDWKVASPYEPRCMVTKIGSESMEARCMLVPHADSNHRWGPLYKRTIIPPSALGSARGCSCGCGSVEGFCRREVEG